MSYGKEYTVYTHLDTVIGFGKAIRRQPKLSFLDFSSFAALYLKLTLQYARSNLRYKGIIDLLNLKFSTVC